MGIADLQAAFATRATTQATCTAARLTYVKHKNEPDWQRIEFDVLAPDGRQKMFFDVVSPTADLSLAAADVADKAVKWAGTSKP